MRRFADWLFANPQGARSLWGVVAWWEIRRMLDQRQGIPAVLSEFHAIASGREILLHDANDRVVIVDDEDTGPLARHSYSYFTSLDSRPESDPSESRSGRCRRCSACRASS